MQVFVSRYLTSHKLSHTQHTTKICKYKLIYTYTVTNNESRKSANEIAKATQYCVQLYNSKNDTLIFWVLRNIWKKASKYCGHTEWYHFTPSDIFKPTSRSCCVFLFLYVLVCGCFGMWCVLFVLFCCACLFWFFVFVFLCALCCVVLCFWCLFATLFSRAALFCFLFACFFSILFLFIFVSRLSNCQVFLSNHIRKS